MRTLKYQQAQKNVARRSVKRQLCVNYLDAEKLSVEYFKQRS